MINYDDITKENKTDHNSKRPEIPEHPYRISIIGGSGSSEKNSFLNLVSHQPDIDFFIYILKTHRKQNTNF